MRREVEPPSSSSSDVSRFQLWVRPSSPEPVALPLFFSFADFFVGATVWVFAPAVALLVVPIALAILRYSYG